MLDEQRYVFAVGQLTFEDKGNPFCTLVPVCRLDGEPVSPGIDFPNRGLCWWLVRGGAVLERAEPGQLLVGPVEPSRSDASDPDKDRFQIRYTDARLGGETGTLLEVLDAHVPGDEPRHLLDPKKPLELDHVPSSLVLVRLGAKVFGPFRAQASNAGGGRHPYRVTLRNTGRPDVMELDASDLDAVGGVVSVAAVAVSVDQQPVVRPGALKRQIAYSFLPWRRFEQLKARGLRTRRVEPDTDVLRRVAKEHLRPKEKVRQLAALLDELAGALDDSAVADGAAARDVVRRKREALLASEDLAAELAEALIASGALKAQVEHGIEARYQAHLESRAAEAEAAVAAKTATAEKRLLELEAETDVLADLLAAEREAARRRVAEELASQKAQAAAELAAEAERIEQQRSALQREQKLLARALEAASARFADGRSQLLADALALQPALKAMGLAAGPDPSPTSAAAGPVAPAPLAAPDLPAWHDAPRVPRQRLSEEAFLDRFLGYVRAAGYRFREADLRAFHLLAKCGDLTVLGGPSGTGKSSLVRLYAAALAGDDQQARSRLLVVDVSPSWTEPADLLGAANLLDRRYEPAPTGLFWHLAAAAREHERSQGAAGVVSVCLDEMNLAQPEHYLAGFLQALERPQRSLRVFEQAVVREDDPARAFATLALPPNLRVFGTVNFDETTRPLSLRLRDRAAVMELEVERHAGLVPRAGTEDVRVEGPAVTLADLLAWTPDGALPPGAAALLDGLQPFLVELGAPVTARRATAIRRMLAAAPGVTGEDEALDLALATRVVPLIRNTHRPGGRHGAQELRSALAGWGNGHPRATLLLDRLLAAEQEAWDAFSAEA